jgi:hypothetical protein
LCPPTSAAKTTSDPTVVSQPMDILPETVVRRSTRLFIVFLPMKDVLWF